MSKLVFKRILLGFVFGLIGFITLGIIVGPPTAPTPPAPTVAENVKVPVVCNENDYACRKRAEENLQVRRSVAEALENVRPGEFCENMRAITEASSGTKSTIKCQSDDPTYQAVRDGVRDALQRR